MFRRNQARRCADVDGLASTGTVLRRRGGNPRLRECVRRIIARVLRSGRGGSALDRRILDEERRMRDRGPEDEAERLTLLTETFYDLLVDRIAAPSQRTRQRDTAPLAETCLAR
ncbi:MAG: hypothetical protein ACREJB_19155 [Planctomycetaceae bacterium]